MSSFPPPTAASDLGTVIKAVQLLFRGKMNATTTVTLAASATTTTLQDSRIGGASHIAFTPLTANAKAEGTPAVTTRAKGSATLTHANNAQTDRTYSVLVIG